VAIYTRGQSFELMVKLNDGYNTRGISGAPVDLLLKMQEEKHALNLEMERLKNLRNQEPRQKHWAAEIISNNPEILNGVISFGKIAGGKLIDMLSNKQQSGISAPAPINAETSDVLEKFKKIDADYFSVLKRMANLVSGEPSMYWQFKEGLGFDVPDDKLK